MDRDIHREWIDACSARILARRAALERTAHLWTVERDALVTGYETLTRTRSSDPTTVTFWRGVSDVHGIKPATLRDFPDVAVEPYGIEVGSDGFFPNGSIWRPGLFCEVRPEGAARLVSPPLTVRNTLRTRPTGACGHGAVLEGFGVALIGFPPRHAAGHIHARPTPFSGGQKGRAGGTW